jgi:hypothetical protein
MSITDRIRAAIAAGAHSTREIRAASGLDGDAIARVICTMAIRGYLFKTGDQHLARYYLSAAEAAAAPAETLDAHHRRRILGLLTPAGVTAEQCHRELRVSWKSARRLLDELQAQGAVVSMLDRRTLWYYTSGTDLEATSAARQDNQRRQRPQASPRLSRSNAPVQFNHKHGVFAPDAAIVVPPGLQVTRCPGYQGDYRIQIQPEPGWQGEITRDWLMSRQGSAS